MSEDTKNKQCQICKGYLFEDDDTVVCPQCGAPHHRDCWDTVGHCGVEENHGTDKQYDKQKNVNDDTSEAEVKTCRVCGRTSKASGTTYCPYCGQPYEAAGSHKVFVNGVPFKSPFEMGKTLREDGEIEGVKISDIAKFTGAMAIRYIQKFKALTVKNKKSWNWAAFLLPSAWCLSRRMYRNGIMFLILAIASSLCFVPFNQTLFSLGETSGMTNKQLVDFIMNNSEAFSPIVIIMAMIGVLLWILPRIFAGLFGDWIFRGYALDKIKRIRNDNEIENVEFSLAKNGAPSILLMFAAIFAEQYLPAIIAMFVW